MNVLQLQRDESAYPGLLSACLGPEAPVELELLGRVNLLEQPKLAVYCSSKCPGTVLTQAYDLANALRQDVVAVMSGFHAPVEREWWSILSPSPARIIRCPARELVRRRLQPEEYKLLQQQRLLLMGFGQQTKRTTQETAFYRNVCMAALAEWLFIAHAAPGSKTWTLCRQALLWGKPVYTFRDPANDPLASLGVQPVRLKEFMAIMQR
jgi:predicted Rossmann fold nucleotide-binding protein DprA/Smf involved in DNA uptake